MSNDFESVDKKREHIEKNIVARKRKSRSRKAHLRRLQGSYDRLYKNYVDLSVLYTTHLIQSNNKIRKLMKRKKWYQFWK